MSLVLCCAAWAQDVPAPERPVATKVIRPGVSGVAGIPPAGGWLISEGFSRQPFAAGVLTSGLTGFYEYSFTNRFAVAVIPTYVLHRGDRLGGGNTSVNFKFLTNRETAHVPLFAIGYLYDIATSDKQLGVRFPAHRVTLYADKNVGRTRFTGNFIVRWEKHPFGFVRQVLPSAGVLTRIYGHWGAVLQGYYSHSRLARYGGMIAAPSYHFNQNISVYAGIERGFGKSGPGVSFVAGMTFLYRGAR